eukprot:5337895-Pleurochrysis_carterae.AAC.3
MPWAHFASHEHAVATLRKCIFTLCKSFPVWLEASYYTAYIGHTSTFHNDETQQGDQIAWKYGCCRRADSFYPTTPNDAKQSACCIVALGNEMVFHAKSAPRFASVPKHDNTLRNNKGMPASYSMLGIASRTVLASSFRDPGFSLSRFRFCAAAFCVSKPALFSAFTEAQNMSCSTDWALPDEGPCSAPA